MDIQEQINSLNQDQKEVALCMGHCLTIAAPGSGKTKTLAVKAAYLLSQGRTVSAVTFTRDAALELRDRIVLIAGKEALPRLLVGTFHSMDLLMAFPNKAKSGMGQEILSKGFSRLSRPWEIVKESTRISIVARAMEASKIGLDLNECSRIIETIKSGQSKPETESHEILVNTYVEIMNRHGVIDFQDILLETNKAISTGQISPLQTDHLMIDEFQDTDEVQYKWAMLHADAGSIVTAVGDDDQSIYGFRRALGYQGMVRLQERLHATRIVLGLNYRSHEEVLVPSAKIISVNQDRMEKDLVSFKGPGGSAYWDRFNSRNEEAEAAHKWAQSALAGGASVGILARTNKRLDKVETVCIRTQTPYTRAEGGSILNSREMAVYLSMLGLMTRDDMRDADEVLAWAKLPEDEIKGIHKSLGSSGFVKLDKTELAKLSLCSDSKSVIASILRLCSDWRKMLNAGSINFVLDEVNIFLTQFAGDDKRIANDLDTVREAFRKPLGRSSGLEEIQAHIERIREMQCGAGKNKKEHANSPVCLLTAHGSKGLEYDHVWILGAEDEAFPDKTASVQEERRLFFVAMTRARKHLMVSASGSVPLSQFVSESGLMRKPIES